MENNINTRRIALDILMRYEREGIKLTPLLLDVLRKYEGMDRRDRAFVVSLVEGVVERMITLDWVIYTASDRPLDKMKPVIRMIIRLGAYQLLFMDSVPDSASVNEAVKLVRSKHMDGLSGFVNGVLRAIARFRDERIEYPNIETEYSCPHWIAYSFRSSYGDNKAEAMIRAGIGAGKLYLRVNQCLTDKDSLKIKLADEGIEAESVLTEAGIELPYTLIVKSGKLIPSESECFNKGLYSVQDLSSQRAIYDLWERILVYIKEQNKVDINIIDLCAAPGGKSCFLAELLDGQRDKLSDIRYTLKAFDVSDAKLNKIRENMDRTGSDNICPEVNDATVFNEEMENTADIIIADLPCSGLGVVGRKVDIRYRVKEKDIIALCKLQREILDNAKRYLKPNGILMFSVCTVTREETAEQASYIEKLGLHKISERLFLQGVDPCDGFYYSIWQDRRRDNNYERHF